MLIPALSAEISSILSVEVAVCFLVGFLCGVKDMPLRTVTVFALIIFLASPVLINQVIGAYDFQFLLTASGFGATYFALGWLLTGAGESGWRKATAALRPRRQAICGRGRFSTSIPRARRGPVPGLIHATAVVRHSLGKLS